MPRISLAEILIVPAIVGVGLLAWFGVSKGDPLKNFGLDVMLGLVTVGCCLYAIHHYDWKRPVAMLLTIPLAVGVGVVVSLYLIGLGVLGAAIALLLSVVCFGYLAWAKSRRAEQ